MLLIKWVTLLSWIKPCSCWVRVELCILMSWHFTLMSLTMLRELKVKRKTYGEFCMMELLLLKQTWVTLVSLESPVVSYKLKIDKICRLLPWCQSVLPKQRASYIISLQLLWLDHSSQCTVDRDDEQIRDENYWDWTFPEEQWLVGVWLGSLLWCKDQSGSGFHNGACCIAFHGFRLWFVSCKCVFCYGKCFV